MKELIVRIKRRINKEKPQNVGRVSRPRVEAGQGDPVWRGQRVGWVLEEV